MLSDYADDPLTGIDVLNRNRGFAWGVGDGVDAGLRGRRGCVHPALQPGHLVRGSGAGVRGRWARE